MERIKFFCPPRGASSNRNANKKTFVLLYLKQGSNTKKNRAALVQTSFYGLLESRRYKKTGYQERLKMMNTKNWTLGKAENDEHENFEHRAVE